MTEIKTFNRRAYPADLVLDRWQAADGWDHRRWTWPAAPGADVKGSMIFQTGRGDIFEKYLETLAHWHDLGWHLTGFDWRGQSGSGRLLKDTTIGHAESFDPWVDDLDHYLAEWRQTVPGPYVLASHSMGGHIAMRLLIDRHPDVDAALFSAPMLKMRSKPLPQKLAQWLARANIRLGFGEQHAWQENERPSLPGSSRQKLLTHDLVRYSDEEYWYDEAPSLKLGPPSWRWLQAGYISSGAMFVRGTFEAVTIPILLLAARKDRLVRVDAVEEAARRLPDAKLVIEEHAAHELLREIDVIRDPLIAEIDQFLSRIASTAK